MDPSTIAGYTGFPVLLSGIAHLVNEIVSESYMDEIFHIPQAEQYCKLNFGALLHCRFASRFEIVYHHYLPQTAKPTAHWDDKITTFPGLYLASTGVSQIAEAMFQCVWERKKERRGGGGSVQEPNIVHSSTTNMLRPGFCNVATLRAINSVFAMGILVVAHQLLKMRMVKVCCLLLNFLSIWCTTLRPSA